jgi:hypothetical protein
MFKEITFNRRRFLGTAAMVMAAPQLAMIGCAKEQSSKADSADATTVPGSVSGAPNLPDGFTDTFTSRYVDTGGLRQHAVIGGEGPPLLLVHGWPQNWYAWRLLMPELARDFEVIAVDSAVSGSPTSPRTGTTPAPSPATWSR